MFVKAWGGGLKALADMSAQKVFFLRLPYILASVFFENKLTCSAHLKDICQDFHLYTARFIFHYRHLV